MIQVLAFSNKVSFSFHELNYFFAKIAKNLKKPTNTLLIVFLFIFCFYPLNVKSETGSNSNSYKADPIKGKQVAGGVCAGCHGKDGITAILPSYPILAGQHQDYLSQALHDYRSGARQNAVMSGIASTLTNEDITNISAYFSTMPSPLHLKIRQ